MSARGTANDRLLQRIRSEFLEMPGLRLTCQQAQRLWGLDEGVCAALLDHLVDAEFLSRSGRGMYSRLTDGRMRPLGGDAGDLDPRGCIDVDVAARWPVNVLVTARSAHNRAAVARMIHAGSARCDGPFVAVCSPPPPASIRPGVPDVDGWFERAAGGTLFIDQVGRLSRNAQATLLSRLTRETRRANRPTMSRANHQVRVIAGSDRSLRADLGVGLFSDELFYRLNEIHIDQTHRREAGAAPTSRAFAMRQP